MLYRLHTNIFIISLLTFGIITALAYKKSMSMMTLNSLVALVTQLALLLFYSRENEVNYTERSLFFTVSIYTFLLGIFFMIISEYYDGDNFLFSKLDAMFYFTQSSRAVDKGLLEGIKYLTNKYSAEDWGALLFDTFVLYLIPNKLFLNAIYTILGAIASVFLYRIGKAFMPEGYAFLSAMSYSTSSYIVFFNCSFLKESLFVFIVVCTYYYIYRVIAYSSNKAWFGVIIGISLIFFFRPALIAFIAVSICGYYAIYLKGRAVSLFLYMAAIVGVAVSLKMIQQVIDSNTSGGNMDAVIADTSNAAYSSSFNYFVSFFGAFFGPFPSLLPRSETPTSMEFLGAGLSYRLYIIIPFWLGVYYAIKKWVIELIPMIVFIILEMFATGYVCASLELRKVILHVPLMSILSYYGMYKVLTPSHFTRLVALPCYLFPIGVIVLWNVIKVNA